MFGNMKWFSSDCNADFIKWISIPEFVVKTWGCLRLLHSTIYMLEQVCYAKQHVCVNPHQQTICDYSSVSPRKSATSAADAQTRVEAGKEGADGADLSSITSMMSTVMKAAQLNGGVEVSNKTPSKTKSPSASRQARKSQVYIEPCTPLHTN